MKTQYPERKGDLVRRSIAVSGHHLIREPIGAHAIDLVELAGLHVGERIVSHDAVTKDLHALHRRFEVHVVQAGDDEGDIRRRAAQVRVQPPDGVGMQQHVFVDLHVVRRLAQVEHRLERGAHRGDVLDHPKPEAAILLREMGETAWEAGRADRRDENGYLVGKIDGIARRVASVGLRDDGRMDGGT